MTRASAEKDAEARSLNAEQIARFWSKASIGRPDECWVWQQRCYAGYGRAYVGRRLMSAHRVAFIVSGNDLSDEQAVDHICRNRSCVNPSHLRAVSQRINAIENSTGITARNAAKTHCIHGHPLNGANLRRVPGGRECWTCRRERDRKAKRVVRAAAIRALPATGEVGR